MKSDSLMTIKQAAECLALNPECLYRLIWEDELPAVRLGKRIQLRRSHVEHWVKYGFTTSRTRKRKPLQDKLKPQQ